MAVANLPSLVRALDSALGRPPFCEQPSVELLTALVELKLALKKSVEHGSLKKDAGASEELKMTLPVLAAAYARGTKVSHHAPTGIVFEALLDCVVLALPVITYTLKDLLAQALKFAPKAKATAQLYRLAKSFTKFTVLRLLYGEGVEEDSVKAPPRPPPKPKKNAPAPPPWAPPPLVAPSRVVAELATAYGDGTLAADCKPFVFDIFVSHSRFASVVGDDEASAATILKAMFPMIRATLHPAQLLRALGPQTDSFFVKLAEDKPDFAPDLLEMAQTMTGLTPRHAVSYRESLAAFIRVEGYAQRPLGEFIATAVLCALVTRTTRLMPKEGESVFADFENSTNNDASADLLTSLTNGFTPAISPASPSTPVPHPPSVSGLPLTDAIPQLIVSGALGYRVHSQASNAALVLCAESLVVMDRHIGRLSKPIAYDLAALNDALTRYMDVAMDVNTSPLHVGLALTAAMHLVDTVLNYKGAPKPADAKVPTAKQTIALGANMPICRAIALCLTLDCSRAVGKHIREFAAVWLGHMLRSRHLALPSILRCAANPLFIVPKAPKGAQSKAPPAKASSPPKKGGGKANAAHTEASESIVLSPSAAQGPPPNDGMRILLFKLLQSCGTCTSPGTRYLVEMVLQQLEVLSDQEEERCGMDAKDRIGLLSALCSVPMVGAVQYLVDEVLDAEDADSNPESDKRLIKKVLVKQNILPTSRLEGASGVAAEGGLAVEEDDQKWMAFITEVEEARSHSLLSAADAQKKEAADRLAAARKAQADYALLKQRMQEEQAEAAKARESKLERQREIVEAVQSLMAQREKDQQDAVEKAKARRVLMMRRVQMLDAERKRREAANQEQMSQATRERRELAVSLKEYLIDTLKMDPSRVYPILSFLRTQIDSLSSDEVHEYLVTGSMSVPLDMMVDAEDDEAAEIVNLEEHEIKSRVAKKYLKTHEGMDFWGGTIEFAPAEEQAAPADLINVKTSTPTSAAAAAADDAPKYVMSFHRRVSPILDAFDYSRYEETGTIPPLTRDALSVVVSRAVLDDRGFANLTEAIFACSSKGLMAQTQGVVELTPLGAAYHAPFANAEKSFQRVFEEKAAQLRKSLEAKKAQMEREETSSSNGIFADHWA